MRLASPLRLCQATGLGHSDEFQSADPSCALGCFAGFRGTGLSKLASKAPEAPKIAPVVQSLNAKINDLEKKNDELKLKPPSSSGAPGAPGASGASEQNDNSQA